MKSLAPSAGGGSVSGTFSAGGGSVSGTVHAAKPDAMRDQDQSH